MDLTLLFTGIISILLAVGIVSTFPGFLEAAINVIKGGLVLVLFFMGLLLVLAGLGNKEKPFNPPDVEIKEKPIR